MSPRCKVNFFYLDWLVINVCSQIYVTLKQCFLPEQAENVIALDIVEDAEVRESLPDKHNSRLDTTQESFDAASISLLQDNRDAAAMTAPHDNHNAAAIARPQDNQDADHIAPLALCNHDAADLSTAQENHDARSIAAAPNDHDATNITKDSHQGASMPTSQDKHDLASTTMAQDYPDLAPVTSVEENPHVVLCTSVQEKCDSQPTTGTSSRLSGETSTYIIIICSQIVVLIKTMSMF